MVARYETAKKIDVHGKKGGKGFVGNIGKYTVKYRIFLENADERIPGDEL